MGHMRKQKDFCRTEVQSVVLKFLNRGFCKDWAENSKKRDACTKVRFVQSVPTSFLQLVSLVTQQTLLYSSTSLVIVLSLCFSFFLFCVLCWLQLFAPTTVIKHQLAHLQSCINEAQQPTAGAAGCNQPAAPRQENGAAASRYLRLEAGATWLELRDLQRSVDLLTSSQTGGASLTARQTASLIRALLCGRTFVCLAGRN